MVCPQALPQTQSPQRCQPGTLLEPICSLLCHLHVAQSCFWYEKSHPVVGHGQKCDSSVLFKTCAWFGLGLSGAVQLRNNLYCAEPLPSHDFFFFCGGPSLPFLKDVDCILLCVCGVQHSGTLTLAGSFELQYMFLKRSL